MIHTNELNWLQQEQLNYELQKVQEQQEKEAENVLGVMKMMNAFQMLGL